MAGTDRRRRERGAVAITALFFMIALGGMLALGLNVGHMMKVRNQLQNRCDSAALAGAMELDGSADKVAAAIGVAGNYYLRHPTDDHNVAGVDDVVAGDIVTGIWNFNEPNKDLAFTEATTPAGDINAVRVQSGRTSARGNPLSVFFGNFLGASEASVRASAVAVAGAPCEGCSIPIAFADCLVWQNGELNCGQRLVFSGANADNIGFTNLTQDTASVNPPTVNQILEDYLCRGLTAGTVLTYPGEKKVETIVCQGTPCHNVQVGDHIGIQNGNDFMPVMDNFAKLVGLKVVAPVITPAGCPDPQFNRVQAIAGFATFTIESVTGSGNDKSITIRLDCDEETDQAVQGGCSGAFFGTRAPFTRLVR